jgi:hypothetical protein
LRFDRYDAIVVQEESDEFRQWFEDVAVGVKIKIDQMKLNV